jgi:Carboxypeptidase regulatory-like domain
LTLRQLATWTIVLGFALPLSAIERSATISGYVRDASGNPQMGAVVEILDATDRTLTVFSDGAGYYTATGLLPGLYSLKASAPSFLPALREKIGLRPGASINVNVTLNTLLDVMQLGPVRNLPDSDDWKWTLRSVANRPILRIFDDPNTTVEKQDHELRGTLSFLAGSAAAGYGTGSDMSAGFTLERSMFSGGRLAFSGDVGYGESLPAAVLRAGYTHHSDTGGETTIGVTVHRFAPSDPNLHNAALQALALSAGDDVTLADIVELKFGSEMQTIQFLGNVTAFRPYGTADVHLNPDTVLAYEYTTSRPDMRNEKGFDSSPADLSESNPRVAVLNYAPQVERAQHQEVSFSHRIGKNNLQLAAYYDHVGNTVLTGTGNVTAAGGFLLPDVTSGTFSYAGGNLNTNGMRAVLQRKFSSDLTATIDYAYGGALNLTRADVQLQSAQQAVATQRRHAVAAKLSGTLPHTHTRWITSYRWVSGQSITPVDMFNSSPGQSDPYLNVFIRQPIPSMGFLPVHMEAIIDVRNLLAQGYVPVMGQDGQTVYLVQAARSLRGGVAFTF